MTIFFYLFSPSAFTNTAGSGYNTSNTFSLSCVLLPVVCWLLVTPVRGTFYLLFFRLIFIHFLLLEKWRLIVLLAISQHPPQSILVHCRTKAFPNTYHLSVSYYCTPSWTGEHYNLTSPPDSLPTVASRTVPEQSLYRPFSSLHKHHVLDFSFHLTSRLHSHKLPLLFLCIIFALHVPRDAIIWMFSPQSQNITKNHAFSFSAFLGNVAYHKGKLRRKKKPGHFTF